MNFKDLHPPILEIPAHQTWHRVQRTSARRDSVRIKGYVLAPNGCLSGRFDLADEATAYLADSPETALYESLFRREVRSWPHKAGTVRGAAFYPLYPTVPDAALANPALYELLGLVDAIRGGSLRERALAIAELDRRWSA